MPDKRRFEHLELERPRAGFSILEFLISITILLGICAIVMSGMMQMMNTQGSVSNRTEMHSSIRSATEVLQQEIGQAGRITLPGTTPVTMSTVVNTTSGTPLTINTVTVTSAAGMFNGEELVIDAGDNEETVTVSNLSLAANTFTATFIQPHNYPTVTNVLVRVSGAYATGIVPTTQTCGLTVCGSTGTLLKLYGDVNDDGSLQYVEYSCDTAGGNLYRNVVSVVPGATKPAVTASMILLSNIQPNPPDPGIPGAAPCFKYQQKIVGPNTFVVDVSVTLTVQTQNKDPQTGQFQTETKALLNVSPRNVFDGWQLASAGVANRIQPMPADTGGTNVAALLP